MADHALERAFTQDLGRRVRAARALAARIAAAPADEREDARRALREETHSLRGSAAVLGLREIVELADELDRLGGGDDPDPQDLGRLFEQVVAMLPEPEGALERARPSAATATTDILCVDDSEPNLLLLERFLERRGGANFIPARTGAEALELVARQPPHLVLLDLQLPDVSGLEVLERLAATERTAGIPVVVVSADAHADRVAEAQERGARDYLVKPLDLRRLAEVIDALVRPDRE